MFYFFFDNNVYLCTVKKGRFLFCSIFVWLCLLCFVQTAKAQEDNRINAKLDSIDISLLTCGPGNESYSYYGHTGIRIHDKWDMRDMAVNYGLFSFEQDNFVLRFIFGLTDYQMGMMSFEDFKREYEMEGRWVKEQLLNLTPEEKETIVLAIIENSMPENAVYRYNFLYDNCTTRARDILVNHLFGQVKYKEKNKGDLTYRDLVRACTADYPWTRFGNDLLLGVKADTKTTQAQQQFLPEYLFADFSDAVVVDKDGKTRNLVVEERQLLNGRDIEKKTLITPMMCMIALALLVLLITIVEWLKKANYRWFDVCVFTVLGLAGIILTAMIFSQHPTVSLNFQIFLLNPLGLVGLVGLVGKVGVVGKRRGKATTIYMVAVVFILLFLICGIWQTYAEGLVFLALSLLIRYSLKWKMSKDKVTLLRS